MRSPLLQRVRRHRRVTVLFRGTDEGARRVDRRPATTDRGRLTTDHGRPTAGNRPPSPVPAQTGGRGPATVDDGARTTDHGRRDGGLDERTWARLQAIRRKHAARQEAKETGERGRPTTDDGQRTTDDGRRTTDDGRQAAGNRPPSTIPTRTEDRRPRTVDDGRRTTDDGQRTTDDRRQTTDDGRQTAGNRPPSTVPTQTKDRRPETVPPSASRISRSAPRTQPRTPPPARRTPLEEVWPVQRLPETTAPKAPSPPVGRPAEGSVETIPPRRPRPVEKTPPPRPRPAKPTSIPTEIGPLPADLWELIDEQPAEKGRLIQRAASVRQEFPEAESVDRGEQTEDRRPRTAGPEQQTTDLSVRPQPPSPVSAPAGDLSVTPTGGGQHPSAPAESAEAPTSRPAPTPASASAPAGDLSVTPTGSGQRPSAPAESAETPTLPQTVDERPQKSSSLDLEALAEKVYEIIRRKLYLEKERLG